MAGLYIPWLSVHDKVIAEVSSLIAQFPTYTLESTGHSLGGSLTYLSYIALAQNFPGKPITSNALAAFPIGNSIFADFGSAQAGLLRRGNNANDGVPVKSSRIVMDRFSWLTTVCQNERTCILYIPITAL